MSAEEMNPCLEHDDVDGDGTFRGRGRRLFPFRAVIDAVDRLPAAEPARAGTGAA